MENIVIGFPRWTEDATWSGGSWQADYPVSNLGNLPLSRVARSSNLLLTSTTFRAAFSQPRSVRAFALVRHNISLDGLVRIRIWKDAAQTQLTFDSGWIEVWPPIYLPNDLEWEDNNWWDGKYSEQEIANQTFTRPFWLSGLKTCSVVVVEINDTANPSGFVSVGLFEVAQGWQVSVNPSYGYSEGFRFRTDMTEAAGGVKYFDRKNKPRVASGQFQNLPRNEAMGRGYEFLRQYDIDTPFLWFPFPGETQHWLRTAFLARNVDPGRIAYELYDSSQLPFSIEEVI